MWSVCRRIWVVTAFRCSRLMPRILTGAAFWPISRCQHTNGFFRQLPEIQLQLCCTGGCCWCFFSRRQPRCFLQLLGWSFMGSWSVFWFGRGLGAANSCSWVVRMSPPRQVPKGVAERHWQTSASACIRGCHGLWQWWLFNRCALPFSPGSRWGQQKEVPPVRRVGIPSSKVWCERSPTDELASPDCGRQLYDQSR